TGEGGISPYHNAHNGDLIYQIGTGYYGSRSKDGNFSEDEFKKRTSADNVKMIEIKLSQGAKPGRGGILPAKKVTPEIAEIRNIEMGKDVISPPYHKAFNTPVGLLKFVKKCRDLSGGKPVGFKLCIGHKYEFLAICKAMVETGITPDFIAVDGGEGGTGAAPLEFSNSVGMPYREGLAFVYDALVGFNLKRDVQLIAGGKIFTGFHIFRAFALGADACYSARGMMLSLGCIQALECNKNTCPVGVTTQDEKLVKGLVVADKKIRVANFHKDTVESFVELMAAAGLKHQDQITRQHLSRRGVDQRFQTYAELYPYVSEGCLLNAESVPESMRRDMAISTADSFLPRFMETYIEED
ncbi:MAG: FMN-binding glutamate synthase family protein, partial [Saprospiraceae bacterium]|nr:FMN-binding glutamate synthase family protein [Saprospiraceae bacterium]